MKILHGPTQIPTRFVERSDHLLPKNYKFSNNLRLSDAFKLFKAPSGQHGKRIPPLGSIKSGLFNFNLKKERRTFDKCKAVVCCDGFQRMLCWIVVKTEVAKHWREFFTKTNCTQVWTLWQWKHNDDSLLVSQKQQRKERDVVRTAWKWRKQTLTLQE